MAFENVSSILQMGSVFSSFKLLLIAASSSRPQYRSLCFKLLQPFTKDGEVSLRYRCYDRYLRSSVRLSELRSDLLSVLELSVRDTYRLDLGFRPDLVIDGGGNIGLFTLRAAAATDSTNGSPVKFVVCEPLPRNIQQIRKHIDLNQIPAEILPVCLGGVRRQIPFYCREAIDSSFDPDKPYLSTIDIPVYTLRDALGSYPAKRVLIKLDIEGMEIEALESYVPGEQRAVYVVGELHGVAANASVMKRIFHDNGWRLELHDIANNNATFRACSPAAAPLLAWAAGAQSTSPAESRA